MLLSEKNLRCGVLQSEKKMMNTVYSIQPTCICAYINMFIYEQKKDLHKSVNNGYLQMVSL